MRFALSKLLLKTNGIDSFAAICCRANAVSSTSFSLSMTHGPAIRNKGRWLSTSKSGSRMGYPAAMAGMPVRVFIGFDPRESIAYHVLSHSIIRHTSLPVGIAPVTLPALRQVFDRPRDPLQSTDFALRAFRAVLCCYDAGAVPRLRHAVRRDLAELWALRDERYAVMVVKHDYSPSTAVKFLGQRQTTYARKNWSSVMLFNAARCRALDPEYVARAPGLELHQLRWIGDNEVGALPAIWNHLVGEQPANPGAAIVHYTLGGPYFEETRSCEHADRVVRRAVGAHDASAHVPVEFPRARPQSRVTREPGCSGVRLVEQVGDEAAGGPGVGVGIALDQLEQPECVEPGGGARVFAAAQPVEPGALMGIEEIECCEGLLLDVADKRDERLDARAACRGIPRCAGILQPLEREPRERVLVDAVTSSGARRWNRDHRSGA